MPITVLNVFKSMYSEGDDECVVAFLLEPRHATCRPAQLHSLARQEVECLADTVVAVAGKTSQPLRCEDAECVSDSTAAYADLLCPAKALTQSLRTKKRVRRIYERVRTAILQSHAIMREEPCLCLHDFGNCHFCTRIAHTELQDAPERHAEGSRLEQWYQFFFRKTAISHPACNNAEIGSKFIEPLGALPEPEVGHKGEDVRCETSKKRRKKDAEYRNSGVVPSGGLEPSRGPPKLQPSKRPRYKADGSNGVTVVESFQSDAALLDRSLIEVPTLPRVKLTDVAGCTTVTSGPEATCSTTIGRHPKPFKGRRSAAQVDAVAAQNTTVFSAATRDHHFEIAGGSVEQVDVSSIDPPSGGLAGPTQSIVPFNSLSDINVVSQCSSRAFSFSAAQLREFYTKVPEAMKDGTTMQSSDSKMQDFSVDFFARLAEHGPEKPALACASPFSSTKDAVTRCSPCSIVSVSAAADCACDTAALLKNPRGVGPWAEQPHPIGKDRILKPLGSHRPADAIYCRSNEGRREQGKSSFRDTAACDVCNVAMVQQWTGGVRSLKPERGLCASCAFVCVCGFLTPYTAAFVGFPVGIDGVQQPAGPYCGDCWRLWVPQLGRSGINIHLCAASATERQWKYRQCFLNDSTKSISQSESVTPSLVC